MTRCVCVELSLSLSLSLSLPLGLAQCNESFTLQISWLCPLFFVKNLHCMSNIIATGLGVSGLYLTMFTSVGIRKRELYWVLINMTVTIIAVLIHAGFDFVMFRRDSGNGAATYRTTVLWSLGFGVWGSVTHHWKVGNADPESHDATAPGNGEVFEFRRFLK